MRQQAEWVVLLALACPTGDVAAESPAESCPASRPVRAEPPRDPNADPFGSGPWYINEDRSIWAGGDATGMREGSNKVLWIRPQGTDLKVSGRRLDGESPPLTAHIPCCYPTGFQSTSLEFASSGCWEIKATAGESTLTFITEVGSSRANAPNARPGMTPGS